MNKIATSKFLAALLIFFFITTRICNASHILGAEITYTYVQGSTYDIFITYYGSPLIDRPVIDSVYLGDGNSASFARDSFIDLSNDIRINYYHSRHTYPDSGEFHISFIDNNRTSNIANIPNSFFTPFATESVLYISQSTCPNNSVTFADKPIFFAYHNKAYAQNVAVINHDHDSLSFELVPCLGESRIPIPGYSLPHQFRIDNISGLITSDGSPDTTCKWAFAVKISEWKKGILAGYVIRDYILEVLPDTDTTYFFSPAGYVFSVTVPPGFPMSFTFFYVDNSGASMSVFGEPYISNNSPTTNFSIAGPDTIFQTTDWTPDYLRSRLSPYIFTFRGGTGLRQTDFTFLVYVTGTEYDSCYSNPHIDISEITGEESWLNIFPNPAISAITINYPVIGNSFHLKITDALGKKQRVVNLSPKTHRTELDISQLSSGVYFLTLESEQGCMTRKFIKQ